MSTAEDVLIDESEPAPPPVKRKGQRRKGSAFPLPLSTIINFAALILLFVAIALLQQMSGRFTPPPAPADTTPAPMIAPDAAPAPPSADAPAAEARPSPPPEAAPAPPPGDDVPPAPAAKIASVSIALAIPQQPEMDQDIPTKKAVPVIQQPLPDPSRGAEDLRPPAPPVADDRPPRPKALVPRAVLERQVPVEELDGEFARQAYLAANRTIQAPPRTAGVAAPPTPAAGPPAPSDAPSDEFIPFERR